MLYTHLEIEKRIRKLLKDSDDIVIEIDDLGLNDDISEIGIDSRNYIKFLVALEAEFGFEINYNDLLFDNFRSIAKIISYLQNNLPTYKDNKR